jgi:trans-2,3-dihydro-3-hydroxyanthranilate isomerase
VVVSTGNTYMAAEVTPDALDRAVPDINMFRQVRDGHVGFNGRFSLYLYAHRDGGVSSRMFAPLVGTYEDPATGSAATPAAALLLKLLGKERHSIEIHQGVKMGRPSVLRASAWKTPDGIRASVGGSCVPVLSGEARLG